MEDPALEKALSLRRKAIYAAKNASSIPTKLVGEVDLRLRDIRKHLDAILSALQRCSWIFSESKRFSTCDNKVQTATQMVCEKFGTDPNGLYNQVHSAVKHIEIGVEDVETLFGQVRNRLEEGQIDDGTNKILKRIAESLDYSCKLVKQIENYANEYINLYELFLRVLEHRQESTSSISDFPYNLVSPLHYNELIRDGICKDEALRYKLFLRALKYRQGLTSCIPDFQNDLTSSLYDDKHILNSVCKGAFPGDFWYNLFVIIEDIYCDIHELKHLLNSISSSIDFVFVEPGQTNEPISLGEKVTGCGCLLVLLASLVGTVLFFF